LNAEKGGPPKKKEGAFDTIGGQAKINKNPGDPNQRVLILV